MPSPARQRPRQRNDATNRPPVRLQGYGPLYALAAVAGEENPNAWIVPSRAGEIDHNGSGRRRVGEQSVSVLRRERLSSMAVRGIQEGTGR
jgi:hypothetical protein